MRADRHGSLLPVLAGIAVCLQVASGTDEYSIEEMLNGGNVRSTTPESSSAELLETELGGLDQSEEQAFFATSIVTTAAPGRYRASQNAQDAMESLLGGTRGNYHSGRERDCLKEEVQTPGYMSQQISSGLVEAFMHKVHLNAGEKECLVQTIGDLSSEVVDAANDAVKALQGIIGNKSATPSQAASNSAMGMVPYLMDGAIKLSSMVSTIMSLIKDCVEGDALMILKIAGRHLINAKWLEKHILVNGVDIANFLANSIVSFEDCKFKRFGEDVGTALRKVALSKATHSDTLGIPEGIPTEEAVEEVMQGFFEGFFARGMNLIIKDSLDPRVNINIDLHRCIAGNAKLFRTVWAGAWELFASISMNPEQHGFNFAGEKKPRWMGEFMLAMLDVPSAMLKCGIDTESEAMLMEAVKAIGDMDVTLTFPNDIAEAKTATQKVAKAVEAWTDHKFMGFGSEIGKLLRELVLTFLPQKYYVDEHGQLRRQLEEVSRARWRSTLGQTASVTCGAGAVVLMLFAGVKGCRTARHATTLDASIGSDVEMLE